MKTIVDKIVIVIILALVFSSLSPPIHAKEVTGCKLYYVVKQGDTLAKIASAMGMAPMQRAALKIAKTNDIDNKNIIEVGDKLCVDENIIKTGSQALECYKISSKKKICMDKDSLKTVLASKKDIEIGNTKKCKSFHAIKKGESLSIIAKRLEMSPPYESALKLAQISGIKDPARVEIGDKVCVDKKYLKVADTSSNAKGFTCFKTKNNRKFCIEKNAIRAIKSGTEAEVVPDIEKTKPQVMPVQMEKAQTPQPDLQHQDNAEELMKKIEKQMEPEPSKQLTTEPANSKTESEIKSESKPKLETQEAEPEVLTGFAIEPFLSFSRIDAVENGSGAKGSILSKTDSGFEFKIMQIWGDYFTSEIIMQPERRTYQTNSGRAFAQHGGSMFNFGAGIGVRPFKRLEFKLRVLYGDEFYFRAPDITSLAIDRTKSLKADIAIYFDIVTAKYASTGLGGGARVIKGGYVDATGGVGYNTKTGYGYFGTFYMRHRFGHVMFEESFTYENIIKDSDLFKQTHMAAYGKFGMILLF